MCSIRTILLVLSDLCFFNEEFSDIALYHWEIVLFSITYLLLLFNEEFSDFALYHWEIIYFSLRYLLLFKVVEKSPFYGFGHWDIVLFFANTFVMEKSSILMEKFIHFFLNCMLLFY